MANESQVNRLSGSVRKNMIIYAVPLILSGLLQILYNSADLIVVGKFAGTSALASVGATSSLLNLIVTVFLNFSVGVSVVVAKEIGAGNKNRISDSIGTSYFLAGVFGAAVLIIGITCSEFFLELMKTPADIIDGSTLYMKIYFLGVPASLVYNFGAAVISAAGDTKRPLYYLTFSGIVNIILNLVLVIVFKLSVAGVAIATTVSQYVSAFFVTRNLIMRKDECRLLVNKIRFYKNEVKKIVEVGLPAGIQGAAFSLSNVVIQSSINIFGKTVIAGNTASANIEAFTYTAMNGVSRTTLNFAAQNVGAGNKERMPSILWYSILYELVVGGVMGIISVVFAHTLLGFYVDDAQAIMYGTSRLWYIAFPYFMCGIMEVGANMVRASDHPVLPAISTIVGVCGLRMIWIAIAFPIRKTPETVYLSYIISWTITAVFHFICYYVISKKRLKEE